MLEQIAYGFQLVIPLFIIMAMGGLFRRRNIVTYEGFRDLNTFAFRLFLPANVFYSMATIDRSQLFHPTYGLILFVGILLSYIIPRALIPRILANPQQQGVVIQSIVRGNYLIIGLSLLQFMYGPPGLVRAGITILISTPVYNVISVLSLTGMGDQKLSLKSILHSLLVNPFMIATFLGLLTLFIPLPDILLATLKMLSQASGPMAIFALGGLMELQSVRSNQKILNAVAGTRLLLMPGISLLVAYLLKQSELSALTLMLFFGAPVGVLTHSMVQRYGGDEELSGQLILYTTALSLFSYAFWIGLIRYLF